MRAKAKRTSLADIRTTGFVQLDASRPEKRARCDAWDPVLFDNNLAGNERVADSVQAVVLGHPAEPQASPDEVTGTKGESLGNLGVKAEGDVNPDQGGEQVSRSQEPAPGKKSLRHFSRTKSSRLRKCLEAPKNESTDKRSDPPEAASAASLQMETPDNGVDMHQLPDDMKCVADDDSLDSRSRDDVDSRLDCSISGSDSTRKDDLETIEDCLNFLEEFGLFKDTCWIDNGEEAPTDPGYVGDGSITLNCKVCGGPETVSGTLVCDICEETFHMACCYPKIRSVPRDDRWFCSFCTRKRKKKSAELKIYPAGHFEEKFPPTWKIDRTKTRGWDLQRMERTHVRVGSKYQAEVPDWKGNDVLETLDAGDFGTEVHRSEDEKLKELELAEQHLTMGITPKCWLPVSRLSEGEQENWLQCQNVLFEEGDLLPDGSTAPKDIICGKWRRAPLHIIADDGWECSCAVVWDPRHADCAVPQELSAEEIRKRPKARMQSPSEAD